MHILFGGSELRPIVTNLFQVSINIDITKTTNHCTTYKLLSNEAL